MPVPRYRLPLLLSALVVLLGIALYLRTAPQRRENALRTATVKELEANAKADATDARAFYYLGLRYRDLGRIGPAHAALAHAAQLNPDAREVILARFALARDNGADTEANALLLDYLKRNPNDAEAHRERAAFLAERALFRDALPESKRAAELDPESAPAWRLTGVIFMTLNQTADAEAALRNAVERDPRDWRASLALGDALSAQRKGAEAIGAYRKATEIAPKVGEAQAALGKALLQTATTPDALTEAAALLEKAVEKQPNSVAGLTALVSARMRQNRPKEAVALLARAEKLAPTDRTIPYAAAALYRKIGATTQATAATARASRLQAFFAEKDLLLNRLTQMQFDAADALKLARLCAEFDDFPEARRQYRRLLKEPGFQEIAQKEIAALLARWNVARAQTLALSAVSAAAAPEANASKETPDAVRLGSLLVDARAALEEGRYDEAIAAGRAALAAQQDNDDALEIIGVAANAEGRIAEAFPALKRAIERNPKRREAQFALAHTYILAGFKDEARHRLEDLVNQFPDDPTYLNALGLMYQDQYGVYDKAQEVFRKAVALRPNAPEYAVNLARMLAFNGKTDESEKILRSTLAKKPDFPPAQAALGMFLARIKPNAERLAESERLLYRSLQSDPTNEKAVLALSRLLIQRQNAGEAVPLLEAAIGRRPSAELFFQLSRAYDQSGNKERATYCRKIFEERSIFDNAISRTEEQARITPDKPEYRLKLARLYARLGDFAKSLNQYQVYQRMKPDDSAAKSEFDALTARLTASGQTPPMEIFNQMVELGHRQ